MESDSNYYSNFHIKGTMQGKASTGSRFGGQTNPTAQVGLLPGGRHLELSVHAPQAALA